MGSDSAENLSSPLQQRYDALLHYAKNILANSPHIKSSNDQTSTGSTNTGTSSAIGKVCIIGGGIGGLYAAMMLKKLDIKFDILEADDYIGGRLRTFEFPDGGYYDAGAHFFPEMPVTEAVFKLFRDLGLKLNKDLIKHELKDENNTLYFNSTLRKRSEPCETAECFNFPDIPSKYSQTGWPELVNNAIQPFVDKLVNDLESKTGEEPDAGYKMMTDYDIYSVRAYLSGRRSDSKPEMDELEVMPYPPNVVDWCETLDRTIGRYNHAITERVIERLALAFPSLEGGGDNDVPCYRVEGGSEVIINRMREKIKAKVKNEKYNCEKSIRHKCIVRRIAYKDSAVEVTFSENRNLKTEVYDHVITTTSLPCLRCVDLQEAELDFYRSYAIRSISYSNASRVGINFKRAWWEDSKIMKKTGPIKGGQSYSDNMANGIVYPTQKNVDDSQQNITALSFKTVKAETQESKPSALVFSFYSIPDPPSATINSSQFRTLHGNPSHMHVHFHCVQYANRQYADAEYGTISMNGILKQMVLRDLALSHGLDEKGQKEIENLVLSGHSFSWDIHPYTLGALPRFGPGQFRLVYENLTRPAARGRLHFAGEATSIMHSWVSGTLSASRRAVEEILYYANDKVKLDTVTKTWGEEEEWDREIIRLQVEKARGES